MFGEPEAPVAPRLSVLGERNRTGDGCARAFTGAHADEVENGNWKGHAFWMMEDAWRVQRSGRAKLPFSIRRESPPWDRRTQRALRETRRPWPAPPATAPA